MKNSKWVRSLVAAIAAGSAAGNAALPAPALASAPYVIFNERQVEGWAASADVLSSSEMLRIVWEALPSTVTVYPTENYYYFTVFVAGRTFNGNILLGPDYLERGVFSFAYTEITGDDINRDPILVESLFSSENGALIDRLSKSEYRIEIAGKSVTFKINEVDTRQPEGMAAASETYLGRVFDESGVIFILLYDQKSKTFAFILDDAGAPVPLLEIRPEVHLHSRSGFVFVEDDARRKVLAAVYRYNTISNNYYDGPFDQLDYNNTELFDFRAAIIDSNPNLNGRIDEYGNYIDDQDTKAAIIPYWSYIDARAIGDVRGCLGGRRDWAQIYRCIKTPAPQAATDRR